MPKTSRTDEARHDFERAQATRNVQRADLGIRFKSATAAVGWYFETRQRMSSPQGMHPRGTTLPDGSGAVTPGPHPVLG